LGDAQTARLQHCRFEPWAFASFAEPFRRWTVPALDRPDHEYECMIPSSDNRAPLPVKPDHAKIFAQQVAQSSTVATASPRVIMH
jgi:hypothetical protein